MRHLYRPQIFATFLISFHLIALGAQAPSVGKLENPPQASTVAQPKSPDAEIAEISAADQADRQTPPQDAKSADILAQRDRTRLNRTKELVEQNGFQDPHSYDRAALVLQHGNQAVDNLMARELAILACFRKATYNGMPALAEDRYLLRIERLQRFGGTFSASGLSPVQEDGDNAVTDAFRSDMFQPSLAFAKSKGLAGISSGESMPPILSRLQIRMKPDAKGPEWITDPSSSPSHKELSELKSDGLSKEGLSRLRSKVLDLYHRDKLFTPDDYRRAAEFLMCSAENPSDLLLANEWAALAVMRLDARAWKTFAQSWDRFAVAVGQPPRYGTCPGTSWESSVSPAVIKAIKESAVSK